MTIEDKVTTPPEKDKEVVAPEIVSLEPVKAPIVSPVPEVDPTYAGKSLEDVIKMHKNAEALATRKAQELSELKKSPEPTVEDIARLFAPVIKEDDEVERKRAAQTEASLIATNLKVAVLEARSDTTLPNFKENEGRILELANARPYMLYSPSWVKDLYSLVEAEKLPVLLRDAEERGKKSMQDKEVPKVEASIISSSEVKAPAPAPEITREDKLKLVRQGKMKMSDLISETLTDAEKGQKK